MRVRAEIGDDGHARKGLAHLDRIRGADLFVKLLDGAVADPTVLGLVGEGVHVVKRVRSHLLVQGRHLGGQLLEQVLHGRLLGLLRELELLDGVAFGPGELAHVEVHRPRTPKGERGTGVIIIQTLTSTGVRRVGATPEIRRVVLKVIYQCSLTDNLSKRTTNSTLHNIEGKTNQIYSMFNLPSVCSDSKVAKFVAEIVVGLIGQPGLDALPGHQGDDDPRVGARVPDSVLGHDQKLFFLRRPTNDLKNLTK